jgi:major membrane immunogen (membrane-anchored lipoprotein)
MKQAKVLMYAGLIALTLILSACGGKTTSSGGETNATSSNWDQMNWDQGKWK